MFRKKSETHYLEQTQALNEFGELLHIIHIHREGHPKKTMTFKSGDESAKFVSEYHQNFLEPHKKRFWFWPFG